MQISVKRSGGYAGVEEEIGAVDTTVLTRDAADEIEGIVREVGFFSLPAIAPSGAVGFDLYRYDITVVDDERRHVVAFADDGGIETAPLRRIVDAVVQS